MYVHSDNKFIQELGCDKDCLVTKNEFYQYYEALSVSTKDD